MEIYYLVDASAACVKKYYTHVQIKSCMVVGGSILKVPLYN